MQSEAPGAMQGASPADVEILARRFQGCELSRAEWTHEAHLAVGLWHVARYGAAGALTRLRTGIRALNERNGVANTATGGYHETITAAYVQLLAAWWRERRGVMGADGAAELQLACDLLLASPLAERETLFRHWSRAQLLSVRARAEWVEPDLAPLPRDA